MINFFFLSSKLGDKLLMHVGAWGLTAQRSGKDHTHQRQVEKHAQFDAAVSWSKCWWSDFFVWLQLCFCCICGAEKDARGRGGEGDEGHAWHQSRPAGFVLKQRARQAGWGSEPDEREERRLRRKSERGAWGSLDCWSLKQPVCNIVQTVWCTHRNLI